MFPAPCAKPRRHHPVLARFHFPWLLLSNSAVPLESGQIHSASKSISVTFERDNLALERRGPEGRKEVEDHA
jgi:hypothetical protein